MKEIIIAGRDVRIYIAECIYALKSHDQITLKGLDKYADRIIHVFEVLNAVGIELDKKYKNASNKPKFESIPSQIENKETGRIETKIIHKLGLTKIPELYMYTEPDQEIEYSKSETDIEMFNEWTSWRICQRKR